MGDHSVTSAILAVINSPWHYACIWSQYTSQHDPSSFKTHASRNTGSNRRELQQDPEASDKSHSYPKSQEKPVLSGFVAAREASIPG
jgi:hypothetical protein